MSEPGLIALLGSGETTATAGQVYDMLARHLGAPLNISVLETPAGFELNSANVAGRVVDYLGTRLQNYQPEIDLIPARKKGSEHSPDNPDILAPMLHSRMFFAGPGSPTYAVRQLKDSLAWAYLQARHRLGAALVFASAATIAVGSIALPVYEIYKVGEDPHWKPGLGLLAHYGLHLAVVPHWNNSDGGAGLDTSHCFIGAERYEHLRSQLSPGTSVVGIDEQTCLIIDLSSQSCRVYGKDSVHIYCDGGECAYEQGEQFDIQALGSFRMPENPAEGIGSQVWQHVLAVEEANRLGANQAIPVPEEVLALVEERQAARLQKDWGAADRLRQQISQRGWNVVDTPAGPRVEPDRNHK